MENEKNIVITDERIAAYLAGEAAPEEAMVLQEWLLVPANKKHFEKLEATWYATYPSGKPRAINRSSSWEKVRTSIQASPSAPRYFSWDLVLKAAASLLLLTAAGLWMYHQMRSPETGPISLIARDTVKEVRLPDQSTITLSKHTTLTYTDAFGRSLREVHLNGEAFFNIAADAGKPFIVRASHAGIKVVGTSFNVAGKQDRVEVSVAEGKVLVYTVHESRHLQAGQTAVITPDSIQVNTAVDPNSWGYATQRFVFKDTYLHDVFADLAKGSPYAIKVSNKAIENCRLTATFENSSAESIISLIAETLDFKVTKDGMAFILEGEGCP